MVDIAAIDPANLYKGSEAIRICGISRSTFYRAIRAGVLKKRYIELASTPYYQGADLLKLMIR